MKRNLFKAFLLTGLCVAATLTIQAQTPKKYIGTWDQNAPGASGYETAKVHIEKESVTTIFSNSSYKYPASEVKYEYDTLKFNMAVDGEYVKCYLVVKDKTNLVGFATWSTGESDLLLSKKEE